LKGFQKDTLLFEDARMPGYKARQPFRFSVQNPVVPKGVTF